MSSVSSVLLAAPEPRMGTWKSPVLWTTLALVGVMLLGALVIAIVSRWRKHSRQDRPDTGDQLSHFRSLYDRGELTREEFEKIRGKLGSKLRQEMNVSPPVKSEPKVQTEPKAPTETQTADPSQTPETPANGQPDA